MLIIRPEQLEAFQPTAEEAFVQNVLIYLREEHSETVVEFPQGVSLVEEIPIEVLREMVQKGIERGRSYGLTSESSLISFVVLMFDAAPNFDEHPLIKRLLQDAKVPPDSRIEYLLELISDQNWDMVEQQYDPSAWNVKIAEE